MVQETLRRLPKELSIVGNSSAYAQHSWFLTDVFYLEDLHSYLKISLLQRLEPLEYEVAVLAADGKLPVPEVRYYERPRAGSTS